jgi:hypothetical protein
LTQKLIEKNSCGEIVKKTNQLRKQNKQQFKDWATNLKTNFKNQITLDEIKIKSN